MTETEKNKILTSIEEKLTGDTLKDLDTLKDVMDKTKRFMI